MHRSPPNADSPLRFAVIRPGANFPPLVWGMYLGMSWTWVIGMFLPVLLVRDYGQLAWWVFAIPNCVGAAAMGWVLRSPDESTAYVRRHGVACRMFSLVTIAFHLFFAVWMLPRFVGPIGWVFALAAVQLAFTPILKRSAAVAAIGVFAVSAIAASVMAGSGALQLPPASAAFSGGEFVGLGLVCVLGFVCSPYLDLTFHHARQSTSHLGGRVAFGAGFCGFFAAMILLTLFYATRFETLPVAAGWAILMHLGVQILFTVNVHATALRDQTDECDDLPSQRLWLALALAIGMAAGTAGRLSPAVTALGIPPGEILYSCFMSFYGLIAPAYVLVGLTRRRARWGWVAAICGVAAPAYWIAFVQRQMAAAIVGAVIVIVGAVLSRLLVRPIKTESASII